MKMKPIPSSAARRRWGAYTLAELMLALSIFGFSSTAASSLMFATYNTNRAVRGNANSVGQAEVVTRRIVENLRSAVDVTYNSSTGLMIQTPPDSNNYIYAFTYYTAPDPFTPGNYQFHELIQREDMGSPSPSWATIQDVVVIDNLASFTAARVGATYPEVWQLTVNVKSSTWVPNVSRTITVTGRNLTH